MPNLSNRSIEELREIRDIAKRYGGRPPTVPLPPNNGYRPPALIGRIDSGPDDNGRWTGRIVRYNVFTEEWVNASQYDVKFQRSNDNDPAPSVGRKVACRPSCVIIDSEDTSIRDHVFDILPGGGTGQEFVLIKNPLGTGTWNLQGRSIGRVTTYDVATDSWSLGRWVLVEPIATGVFIDERRYAASYAGEDTGGYDGTGTGTIGTGTTSTISVYLADPMGTRLQVVTDIDVECVDGQIHTTITKTTIIALIES